MNFNEKFIKCLVSRSACSCQKHIPVFLLENLSILWEQLERDSPSRLLLKATPSFGGRDTSDTIYEKCGIYLTSMSKTKELRCRHWWYITFCRKSTLASAAPPGSPSADRNSGDGLLGDGGPSDLGGGFIGIKGGDLTPLMTALEEVFYIKIRSVKFLSACRLD